MTKELTRPEFKKLTEFDHFTEYKQVFSDIYRVELGDSFIKCAIQKTDEGVQVIYLDSNYTDKDHYIKLMAYVTFNIAYKKNGKKGFKTVSFNKDNTII